MATSIKYRMAAGIPGDPSRRRQCVIESQVLGATPFPAYGLPAKRVNGLMLPLSLNSDDNPYGWLVRPYPTQGKNPADALGVGVPIDAAGSVLNIMISGYLSVFVQANAGSVVGGGTVYVRYANPSGAAIVGGVEATLIGGTTLALLHCFYTGPADDNGNAEIFFKQMGRRAIDLAGGAVAAAVATGNIP